MHVKLKSTPGIYLVGFMGCGKSTVGRLLAERLGWDFVDLDAEIEERAGSKISEIFETFGEPAFRAMERQSVVEQAELVRQGNPRVVALGGGVFADPRNRETLATAGVSIWLECPVEQLWKRVAGKSERPLASERSSFERLYEERRAHYQEADFAVTDEGKGPQELVEAILALSLI